MQRCVSFFFLVGGQEAQNHVVGVTGGEEAAESALGGIGGGPGTGWGTPRAVHSHVEQLGRLVDTQGEAPLAQRLAQHLLQRVPRLLHPAHARSSSAPGRSAVPSLATQVARNPPAPYLPAVRWSPGSSSKVIVRPRGRGALPPHGPAPLRFPAAPGRRRRRSAPFSPPPLRDKGAPTVVIRPAPSQPALPTFAYARSIGSCK